MSGPETPGARESPAFEFEPAADAENPGATASDTADETVDTTKPPAVGICAYGVREMRISVIDKEIGLKEDHPQTGDNYFTFLR